MNPMSDLTKQSELKNCPFCGGPATLGGSPTGIIGQVYCSNDDCFGPKTTALFKAESIKQWNTRPSSAGVREALANLLVERDSEDDDEECELCGGRGTLDAYTDRTSNESRFDGRDEIGCPACIERHHSRVVRAALSDHGVQKSAAEASTKSDGGVEGHAQRATSAATAPRLAASGMGGIEAPAAGIKPGPSDSLLSKTLTEGEQRSIATKQSTDPEGGSRTETAGGAA